MPSSCLLGNGSSIPIWNYEVDDKELHILGIEKKCMIGNKLCKLLIGHINLANTLA